MPYLPPRRRNTCHPPYAKQRPASTLPTLPQCHGLSSRDARFAANLSLLSEFLHSHCAPFAILPLPLFSVLIPNV